jgi:mono/diheme cytochrome c family protein
MLRTSQLPTLLLLTSLLAACAGKEDPGRTYMPDMRFARAYEYNTESPVFEDGMTNRPPVEGTIPRNFPMYEVPANATDSMLRTMNITNPVEHSDAMMVNAKSLYTIYCAVCHGEKGDGKGTMEKFQYPLVPDYKERLPTISDARMYQSITHGLNMMGSHASLLDPDERWQVIHYIKSLAGLDEAATSDTVTTLATDTLTANPQ